MSDFRLEKPTFPKTLPQLPHKINPSHTCSFAFSKSTIMSAIDMASVSKFPYRRLGLKGGIDDDDEGDRVIPRSKNCCRLRRLPIRRRFRVKVPSLRRLWRKKARLVSALRISCANVIRRFKDGQVRFGDLFAGNYLFTQVNPASLKYLQK